MSAEVVYLIVGLALVLGVMLPQLARNRAISPPLVLLVVGIVVGWLPVSRDQLDPLRHHVAVEHLSEFTIIVALTGVGLALDRPLARVKDAWRRWNATWRLLLIGMPLAILTMTLLGRSLLGLGTGAALLLASALAPTDPVLAGDVQVAGPTTDATAEELDEDDEVRFALTSEAGLNDGAAFPFVAAAMVLIEGGRVGGYWIAWDVVGKTVVGVAVGYAVGWVLGRLAFRAPEAVNVARIGDPLLILCCPLIAYGLGDLAHGWAFVSVFVSAVTMRAVDPVHEYHLGMHAVVERLERLLTLVVLLLLGAALSGGLLADLTVRGIIFAILLIFVARPVVGLIALWSRTATDFDGDARLGPRERLVAAFFGVRGVGTIYYLAWAVGQAHIPDARELWSVAGFTIALSVLVHGVSATPVIGRLDRRREAASRAQGTR